MTNEVVLQELPEKAYCQDVFDGVCVLRGAVEQFFNNRQFVRTQLADMLPCGEEIRVVNAETSIPDSYSTPTIAMSRSDITFEPLAPYALSAQNAMVAHPTLTISFEIKTNNYRTTEYMALELSQFLVTFIPHFRKYNLYMNGVVCGATKQFRDSTPNYFFSKVSVTAGVPLVKWQYGSDESILRSISLSLNIRNGDMEPVAII